MDTLEVGLLLGRLHATYSEMRENGDSDMRTVIHHLEETVDELRKL